MTTSMLLCLPSGHSRVFGVESTSISKSFSTLFRRPMKIDRNFDLDSFDVDVFLCFQPLFRRRNFNVDSMFFTLCILDCQHTAFYRQLATVKIKTLDSVKL